MSEADHIFLKVLAAAEEEMRKQLLQLGESPEAWRGAAVVADSLHANLRLITEVMMKPNQDDDSPLTQFEKESLIFVSIISGVTMAITDHPMVKALRTKEGR